MKRKTMYQNFIVFLGCMASYMSTAQVGNVLWQDNFNTLNTSVWNVITGDGTGTPAGAGWGNNELEYYNTPNVYILDVPGEAGNKALVLEAKSETVGSRSFTSGKVETYGKLSVKYGLVEIRARIPNLQNGLWPALWMLGNANVGWPAKGEIDIAEMGHSLAERTRQGYPSSSVNNFIGSNLIFYDSSATSAGNPSGAASIAYDVNYDSPYVPATSLADRFLTYRMYWSSTSIRFTVVDGTTEIDLYSAPFTFSIASEEFKSPFYFLMNLAVGGSFTDATNNSLVTAPLPAKMYIDYIKVSQWNGEGAVNVGGAIAETGTFGLFTDNTVTTNKLAIGTNADIYAWNNFVGGTTTPFEGSDVIAWQTSAGNTWFGGGIAARQPVNLSNFATGNLKFRIKIPANVNFKIGITDNYTNEKYVSFPANTTKYGLVRDGNWGQVTIPVADFAGALAFQSLNYLFTIVSDGTLPTATFQLGLDDIYYEGGGGSTTVAVTSVAMSPTAASIAVGTTRQLTGTISPTNATNQGKTWNSSSTAVATVSASGLVTAISTGTATITVTTSDGAKTATCAVTITAATVVVTSIAMSPTTASIAVGATRQLTGTISPTNATNQGKTWTSSNTIVATVSASGLVTALSLGTTTITVTTSDGAKTATCAVTVTAATCIATAATGDYTVQVSTSTSNPSLTFIPSRTNVGAGICILYYGTSATAVLPGYIVTPNVPFTITASSGQRIYFYYTYSLPTGGENNTSANKHNFTVGSCSTLVTARQSAENVQIVEKVAGELSIFPNPTQTEIYIQNGSATATYTVMTITGSTVLKGTGDKVDVSSLAAGQYFLKVKDSVFRFIKQ
jgi:uncharacterized protein YjdB/beta-glucanase (GH16 family)